MNKNHLRKALLVGISSLVLITTAQARIPVWTMQPNGSTHITISPTETATINYTVTNQSHKVHTLRMKPLQGITPSGCTAPLAYHQSCTLSLSVRGNALQGDIIGGPVVCELSNSLQCYQPAARNRLFIQLKQETPVQQYTVTPSAGPNGSISPNTPQVVSAGSTLIFTATPDMGYGVDQWLEDGSPVQTGGTTFQLNNIMANHTVNVTFGTVTLTPNITSLALSINCLPSSITCTTTKNAALTGNSRQITITNTGSANATNVSVASPVGLPSGTSISDTCTGTLNAGSSCTITVTPGDTATSTCTSGTVPTPGTITVTADGGVSSSPVDVLVLSYGCQYQGGFIYAVDDTTPNTGNIGGKVASLVDQADPPIGSGPQPTSLVWSTNGISGNTANPSFDIIPFIALTSGVNDSYANALSTYNTTYNNTGAFPFPSVGSFSTCAGATEGACNSTNILTLYNSVVTNYGIGASPYTLSAGPTTLSFYAAGLCTATINGFSDWYLPAICEIDAINAGVVCPLGTQSMADGLSFLIGDPNSVSPPPSTSCNPPSGTNCLAGNYWSSTEYSPDPQFTVWIELFNSAGSIQDLTDKSGPLGVRCSRALTL